MYSMIRAGRHVPVVKQNKSEKNEVEYLTFPNLEQIEGITHLFSTRLGGVSVGEFSSMNFSFTRGDKTEAVLENYERIAETLHCEIDNIVCSDQTHTTNILKVDAADGGKGILKGRDYTDIDGLITNTPGVMMACFFADCVPLYFVDTHNHAIGLAHSGWKGTVAGMGKRMVEEMSAAFGSKPKDIKAAIGPSICRDCYEVSEDVANSFKEAFSKIPEKEIYQEEFRKLGKESYGELMIAGNKADKYQLDLWVANYIILRDAGIPKENIAVTDVCTCCNPQYLFSHRKSMGKRGNLGAFLGIQRDS